MDATTRREVLEKQVIYQRKANKRNASFILRVLMLINLTAFSIVAIVKMIETVLDRFTDQVPFALIISIVLLAPNVCYIVFTHIVYSTRLAPVYDTAVSENRFAQQFVFLVEIPMHAAIVVAVQWSMYSITDNNSDFSTPINGITYTWGSAIMWFVSAYSAFLIIDNLDSFVRTTDKMYNFYTTPGVPWMRSFGQFVEPYYDPTRKITELRAVD